MSAPTLIQEDTRCFVSVPKLSVLHKISFTDNALKYKNSNNDFEGIVSFPPGSWKIILDTETMTEDECRTLMPERCANSCSWPRCTSKDCMYKEPAEWDKSNTQAFKSKLASIGMPIENPLGDRPCNYGETYEKYLISNDKWLDAQSKVVERVIVIEKI